MFAYCNNNPVNYVDTNGQDPITITIAVTAVSVVAVIALGGLLIHVGAKALSTFLDWLSRQWYASFAKISFANEETKKEKEKANPEPPDVTYPGDDPEKAPEGYEWRGPDPQGGKRGGYANPKGKDSWHPDLEHPDDIPPHWDYNDGHNHKWRVFPDHIELVP